MIFHVVVALQSSAFLLHQILKSMCPVAASLLCLQTSSPFRYHVCRLSVNINVYYKVPCLLTGNNKNFFFPISALLYIFSIKPIFALFYVKVMLYFKENSQFHPF